MAYGISFPSTRITSYALRAAYGGIGLDVVLSHDKLLENSAAGTVIGTLACTGVIGTPRFALIDNAAGRVALGGTNNATVVAGLVPSDYETTPFFNFTVSITGTSPQLPNIIFTVFVGDANEFPPVIISDGGSTTAVVSVPENSTAVTTVVATDADIGSVVTYSIVGGADASKFTIGFNSGVLAFRSPPDFEIPTDADGNNQYVVIVQASDGTFTDTQAITVVVTDVFDPTDTIPPVITSAADLNLFENAALAHSLLVENDEPVTWTITGGADAALFSLTGPVLQMTPKNFESPVDANGDNRYIVIVTATDASLNSANQIITVTVLAVNEFAPVITSNGGGPNASVVIFENTVAVTTVIATDADVGDVVTYSVVGGADAAKFTINSTTGVLQFIAPPDFELPTDADANNQYVVIVQASDGVASDTQTITVTVTNVDDTADVIPPFITSPATASVAENAPFSMTLTADEFVTWTIMGGADAALFSLTGSTLSMAAKDFEDPVDTSAAGTNTYVVQVRATDVALNASEQTITVTVTDVLEDSTPDQFTFVDATNQPLNTVVESNSITVTGINMPAALTISGVGGQYQLNGAGAWASTPASVPVGTTVKVRGTSSNANLTPVDITLTIGGVFDTFTITTVAASADTTPDQFTFVDAINQSPGVAVDSNTITVQGINAAAPMTISAGGVYSKNGGAFASTPTTVVNGNSVKVRGTSSLTGGQTVDVTLTIGGTVDTFSITTVGSGTLTPILVLTGLSDTGYPSTDGITRDNTPEFDIICMTAPVAGDIIDIARDGSIVATVMLDASDVAGTTRPGLGLAALADGTYVFTARHTHAGSTSSYSSGVSVTVDTVAPVLTSPNAGQNGSVPSTVDLSVTTNTGQGVIYWVIQDAAAAAPTALQVRNGWGSDNLFPPAGRYGNFAVTSTGVKTASGTVGVSGSFRAYYIQTDIADNTSTVVTPASPWTHTIAAFAAAGVGGFDGATTYMTNTAIAIPAGKRGLISFWLKMTGNAGADRYVFNISTGTTVKLWGIITTANVFMITGRRSIDAANCLQMQSLLTPAAFAPPYPTGWIHVMAWWDCNLAATPTLAGGIYINGVLNQASSRTFTNDNIGYNSTTATIGASAGNAVKFFGNMSELYINLRETLDLSNAANRAKFISSSGFPVALGATGSNPTTNQPDIYLGDNNTAANWGINNGSAGNFTTPAGALTSVTGPP